MSTLRPLSLLPFLFAAPLLFAQEAAVATPTALPQLLPDGMAQQIRAEGIDHSQAMRLLRDLTGKVGHRLTGSDNFTHACAWAMTEFQAMGIPVVKLEKWGEWRLAWNRGVWHGRITVPEDIDLYVATEAWTAGTNGSKVAEIAPAPEALEDVSDKAVGGKWVYYSKRPGKEIRDACEKAGMLGWLYRAHDPDAKYPTRVRVFGQYQTALLPLEKVPTMPEIAIRADQADRIAAMLEQKQLVVGQFEIDNSFRDGGIPLYNVVAEIPGSEKPEEVVIVCGHLDSWHQAQGCTDNGTGATSTMEAARILMAVGAKPKRTIRFCLWGGEEEGLLGSAAYVKMHRTEMDKVSAVLNHDTGTNWAQSLGITAGMKDPLDAVFAPVLELMTPPDSYFDGPVFRLGVSDKLAGMGGSDHASFLAVGVPGLNWGLRGRSNYFLHTWHTQWDTIDVAVPEYQRHTATVIAFGALGIANLDAMLDRSGVVAGGGRGPQSITYAQAMFDAEMEGLKFTAVGKDGRAAKMGVQVGDVLTRCNGEDVEILRDIFRIARDSNGDELVFTLKRGDQSVTAKMKTADLRR